MLIQAIAKLGRRSIQKSGKSLVEIQTQSIHPQKYPHLIVPDVKGTFLCPKLKKPPVFIEKGTSSKRFQQGISRSGSEGRSLFIVFEKIR